jgi:hypothetical protein
VHFEIIENFNLKRTVNGAKLPGMLKNCILLLRASEVKALALGATRGSECVESVNVVLDECTKFLEVPL